MIESLIISVWTKLALYYFRRELIKGTNRTRSCYFDIAQVADDCNIILLML